MIIKRVLIGYYLFFLSACGGSAKDINFETPFVVDQSSGTALMSFNIKRGRDSSSKSIKKLIDFYKHANKNKVVIIGLQEVSYDFQADFLATNYNSVRTKTLSNYGILLLSNTPFEETKNQLIDRCGAPEPRGISAGKIDGIWYVNTHITYRSGAITCQLTSLAQTINTLGNKVVVIGDLNTKDDSASFASFINDTGLNINDSKHTFPATNPNRRIDYILSKGVPMDATNIVPTILSDHLAITSKHP